MTQFQGNPGYMGDPKRGASMGRHSYGTPEDCTGEIELFQVEIDKGGYDDGGSYWGIGKPLWCARCGEDYQDFARAETKEQAVVVLGLVGRI